MIFVDRSRVACPTVLDGEKSRGGKERAQAIAHYSNPARQNADFPAEKFRAYKDDAVKEALNELFHKKCAYCESSYAATAPVDVEHFRPKSAVLVNGQLKRPGYYWLAAEWTNLLPSCIDCNRQRVQEFVDEAAGLSGKANLFPLADEAARAAEPGREVDEQPLLLDPCRDQPEQHLEFLDQGLVRARLLGPEANGPGQESPKGTKSIEIYGLRRKGLVDTRRDWLVFIYNAAYDWIERRLFFPENATRLEAKRQELLAFGREEKPYAGMARQVIAYVEEIMAWIEKMDVLLEDPEADAQALQEQKSAFDALFDPCRPFAKLGETLKPLLDEWLS